MLLYLRYESLVFFRNPLDVLLHLRCGEQLKRSESGRTTRGIGCKSMAVKQRFVNIVAVKCVENFIGKRRNSHRDGSTRKRFGHTYHVRLFCQVTAGEVFPRFSKARHDFIGNRENVVLATNANKFIEYLRLVQEHSRGDHYKRFKNECGEI